MHVHTDRHTHTQGKYALCLLQTDPHSHTRAAPSAPVLAGLTLHDSACVLLPLWSIYKAPGPQGTDGLTEGPLAQLPTPRVMAVSCLRWPSDW